MGRIAETAHTRAQDGAMSGSRSTFLGVQVEVQKEVILGAYKIDVGEAKKANKGPFWGGGKWSHFGGPKWSYFWSNCWSHFKRPNISHVRCQNELFLEAENEP